MEILIQPLAYMAFGDKKSASPNPFLIWCGGISLAILIIWVLSTLCPHIFLLKPPPSHSCSCPPYSLSWVSCLSCIVLMQIIPTDQAPPFRSVAPFQSDGFHHAKRELEGQWPQQWCVFIMCHLQNFQIQILYMCLTSIFMFLKRNLEFKFFSHTGSLLLSLRLFYHKDHE